MLINTALGKKNQAIGRSKGGLSTKIHARTDALGNPTGFYLTDGQAHDLNGSDVLLDLSLSQTWLMDKAYNSRDRVIAPILAAKGQIVMPAKSNSIDQRDYDQHLYKARHLIENFFAKLKQYRAIATRYDKLAQNFLSAIYLASTIIWLNWWHALNLVCKFIKYSVANFVFAILLTILPLYTTNFIGSLSYQAFSFLKLLALS